MNYRNLVDTAKAIRPGMSLVDAIRVLGKPDRNAEDVISYDLTRLEGFPSSSSPPSEKVYFAVELEVAKDRVKQVQFAWIDTKDQAAPQ
jgi:hypothetical protein